MTSPRKALRSAAAAGVVLQCVFLFAASAPPLVWCHRPGGETALEVEVVAGECPCDQCALCRERERAEGPVLRASRCVHNEIDSEAGRASAAFRGSPKYCASGSLPSAKLFADAPDPGSFRLRLPRRLTDDGSGPPWAAALRC